MKAKHTCTGFVFFLKNSNVVALNKVSEVIDKLFPF